MRTVCFAAVLGAALLGAGCRSGPSLPVYNLVPDFQLTDQSGKPFVSKERLRGQVWVANFIFTSCLGPCPRMSSQMRQVSQQAAGASGLQLVSFTIDPARDTPEKLAEYARRYKADPGVWSFLTGPQSALQHLSKDVFMLQDIDGTLQHSSRFVLVDRQGRVRGYYDSSDAANIQQLVADAKALAAAGA